MKEFYIQGNTFAAPFFSDPVSCYVEAASPGEALTQLAEEMQDGIGLFSANAYASADDCHKKREPLAKWRSNKALAVEGAGTIYSKDDEHVEIDGKETFIEDPKSGELIPS